MFSFQDKDRILKAILDRCQSAPAGVLYKPEKFLSAFPPLSERDCQEILETLEAESLIKVEYADCPESDDIFSIRPLAAAFIYFQREQASLREKRRETIRWLITTGIAVLALIVAIVGLFI